jgi:NAD(P)H-nitrite reductase large subunit
MSDDDVVICRCEEVDRAEILAAIDAGADTIAAIRRMTRAGMGLCQGRTCRRLIAQMIAEKKGKKVEDIPPATYRSPVRPMKLEALCHAEGETC